MDLERQWKYEERDERKAGPHFYNKIFEHKFCLNCWSKECADKSHQHIELHPIVRIPKKNASKKKWKEFFELIISFGEDNMRRKRH
jgi:hypothetical protein